MKDLMNDVMGKILPWSWKVVIRGSISWIQQCLYQAILKWIKASRLGNKDYYVMIQHAMRQQCRLKKHKINSRTRNACQPDVLNV